jgi:hypothetical protein
MTNVFYSSGKRGAERYGGGIFTVHVNSEKKLCLDLVGPMRKPTICHLLWKNT